MEWKSWAEDNYDFESGKSLPGLPSDAETKELSQTFCYSNDMEMRQAATQRHFMNQAEAQQEAAEASRGALKSAPPAEEAVKP